MPFGYYAHSAIYEMMEPATFDFCPAEKIGTQSVCVQSDKGIDVLNGLNAIMPLIDSDKSTGFDIGILLLIGGVYKVFYIVGVIYKTQLSAKIHDS